MKSPLLQRLLDEFHYPLITAGTHDAFVRQQGLSVLFFAGDPDRYRDTTDVAVVLPELVKAFDGRLRPAVVAAGDELALQKRWGFSAWPALVFVRDGAYVGTITGIQNWVDYLQQIDAMFSAPPRRPPSIGVPVVGAPAA